MLIRSKNRNVLKRNKIYHVNSIHYSIRFDRELYYLRMIFKSSLMSSRSIGCDRWDIWTIDVKSKHKWMEIGAWEGLDFLFFYSFPNVFLCFSIKLLFWILFARYFSSKKFGPFQNSLNFLLRFVNFNKKHRFKMLCYRYGKK